MERRLNGIQMITELKVEESRQNQELFPQCYFTKASPWSLYELLQHFIIFYSFKRCSQQNSISFSMNGIFGYLISMSTSQGIQNQ